MVYFTWGAVVGLSVVASFVAFFWALRTRQFADSDRARYLPLADLSPAAAPPLESQSVPKGAYVFLVLVALVFASVAGSLALSLRHRDAAAAPVRTPATEGSSLPSPPP
jgi:cbb3-type cytochrome oxidase maturation protein